MENQFIKFQGLLSLFLVIVLISGPAFGFDTGPHFDLTRSVLSEHSFADRPVKIVQVENWLTDYYSSSPTISRSKRQELEKLHFDNLFNTKQVANYWGWLIENLRKQTRKAALENDPFRMLMIMGIGLHAVQDFYTHSNWVETHPRDPDGAYRTDTFLNSGISKVVPPNTDLYTGKYPESRKTGPGPESIPARALDHGGYENGVNKDSPVRPHWDEAYVFAYVASHELVRMLAKWADDSRPNFWKQVREYTLDKSETEKLDYDVRALRNISMWIKGKGQDGHWKGNGSGSARFFSAFSGKWVGKNSSRFVKSAAAGTLQEDLAKNLYSNIASPPLPPIARFDLKRKVIIFRATKIAEIKDDSMLSKRLKSTGGTDFYARVRVDGQEYWDRTLQASRSAADPWFVVHFADQAEKMIPLSISVWDEDDIDSTKDPAIDINPVAGKTELDILFRTSDGRLTGDLIGLFNNRETAFTSGGNKPDSNRALISGYITQFFLR